jgi:SHAQKYF class myb-like DNA-binding protein
LENTDSLVNANQGRWTKEEHFRFLKALKEFGKSWKEVQQYVGSRTSTQARSHGQKFFSKLEKRGYTLFEFLETLDLENMTPDDLEDDFDDSLPLRSQPS